MGRWEKFKNRPGGNILAERWGFLINSCQTKCMLSKGNIFKRFCEIRVAISPMVESWGGEMYQEFPPIWENRPKGTFPPRTVPVSGCLWPNKVHATQVKHVVKVLWNPGGHRSNGWDVGWWDVRRFSPNIGKSPPGGTILAELHQFLRIWAKPSARNPREICFQCSRKSRGP